ncbi:aconitate hydratase [Tistrella bauzanensis]|uniref:Aconitate hydratase n=1 Tax=Tistrella bauzanensis TaxID=657419 RepID=A0ABQ1IDX8_9PROT|nr:aconitate hydratase AcnA [Tistrella bauzanensis]GGB32633.1 aconitate hydratase [Tistrella bauzanensis]
MTAHRLDSFSTRTTLTVDGKAYDYFSLPKAEAAGLEGVSRLPFSLKVLLENLLRHEDGRSVTAGDVKALVAWVKDRRSDHEIAYRPARVLMQDFTGVPAVVDLATMRAAMAELGGDVNRINPLSPVDLVIDHSVQVDRYGTASAFLQNVALEMERNGERYSFLRWGQSALDNFRVVPPGTGICHQVNLEYLAKTVWSSEEDGRMLAYPDTLVGTDSHTTMVNGLAVLGWGVGGIEAEAAMLGQPVSMVIPEVVGFKLTGRMKEGTTATDLVLTVTQMLRKKGVVGKFVEFYGEGLDNMVLTDRATIANMAPEYGATCGFFPIDGETLNYLRLSGRDDETVALVEAYAKAQGMWREAGSADPEFTDTLELDMSTVEPSLAGPKRPQDRVTLSDIPASFKAALPTLTKSKDTAADVSVDVAGTDYKLAHGHVAIAAITSCTNTSNPDVMLGAGLVAKKAAALGMTVKPWVKTSLAPGSKVVTEYLRAAGVQDALDTLGFNLVGYGCTTCIGNSGPLAEPVSAAVNANDLVVTSVLSGNRNFEGRVNPDVRANYLASPMLVVVYALAGSVLVDVANDPIGEDRDGKPVYMRDIWPTSAEIRDTVRSVITSQMFRGEYADVFSGDAEWQAIEAPEGATYVWDENSTYVKMPPYFEGMSPVASDEIAPINGARALAILGDSVTTDHISPAGNIARNSPAAKYLTEHGVAPADFNSYGARRGNHEIMMRGTFANVRIRNEMVPGVEGGYTRHVPTGEQMSIYDAAMQYVEAGTPLVVIAGKEYGTGSSRDWAAKGTMLLGVKAVITESFERIHRSNLVGMGILPLVFGEGWDRSKLGLDGTETYDIIGLGNDLKPRQALILKVTRANGEVVEAPLVCRIDTLDELEYFKNGGILHYVLRRIASGAA